MLLPLCLITLFLQPASQPTTHPDDWYYWTDELTVTPRAVDEASHRIHLRPEWVDPLPGNAALDYLRAADLAEPSGENDEGARYIDTYAGESLDKIDRDDVIDGLSQENVFYPLLRLGTRRLDCAWGSSLPEQGFDVKLTEMNTFRHMANVLLLDGELAIAHHVAVRESPEIWQWQFVRPDATTRPAAEVDELDDLGVAQRVADTVRWRLALTEDLAQQPSIIGPLVAGGIEATAYLSLREYIGSPNAINLLPAMQELGVRQYDLIRAVGTGRQSLYATVPILRRVRDGGTVTRQEIEQVVATLNRYAMTDEDAAPKATTVEALYEEAGGEGDVPQVVAEYMVNVIDTHTSTLLREFSRPFWLHVEGENGNVPSWLPLLDLDSLYRFRVTMSRIQREPMMLMIVEALRDYAARHGELPATLDELNLSIPMDPSSGRPFEYERTDQGFVLDAPANPRQRSNGRRFVVTLRN